MRRGRPPPTASSRSAWPPTASRSAGSPRRPSPAASTRRRPALTRVTLYHAEGCQLCERAREQLVRLRAEVDFELDEVDVTGDPELEAAYRTWLPVVEIDGRRAFVYYLDEAAFRRKLAG